MVCTFTPTLPLDRAGWLKTMTCIGHYSRWKGIAIVTACDAFNDMNVTKVSLLESPDKFSRRGWLQVRSNPSSSTSNTLHSFKLQCAEVWVLPRNFGLFVSL